jgi:hypothetical protein
MTLNLMVINRSGIWQSADMRLTNPQSGRREEDHSVKQVVLRCTDGTAVVAYTGVGSVGRVQTSDWIRQVLRGESRTVDESLIFLREQATKDLGPIVDGRYHHLFTIGAFLAGRPWAAQIRNFEISSGSVGPATRNFTTVAMPVGDAGAYFALWNPCVVKSDLRTLNRVAGVTPRKPNQFSRLLAAINRRAAAASAGYSVSPHCVTTYVPPEGESCEQEVHDVKGATTPVIIPFLLFGIDMTDAQRHIAQAMNSGVIPEMDQIWQESVIPRNPLSRR